jgi:hypothetical protein
MGGKKISDRALLKSQISNLKLKAEGVSRQGHAWADHLQNTSISGQRHLTDHSCSAYDQKRRADVCRQKLRDVAQPPCLSHVSADAQQQGETRPPHTTPR